MADQAGGLIANTDVDSIEQIALINVDGRERLNIEFTVGVAAFTAFEVGYLPVDSASSTYMIVASVTADFTAPPVNHPVRGADSDLTIATVAAHWLVLDTRGIAKVRLRAAGANTTVVGSWGAA